MSREEVSDNPLSSVVVLSVSLDFLLVFRRFRHLMVRRTTAATMTTIDAAKVEMKITEVLLNIVGESKAPVESPEIRNSPNPPLFTIY